MHQRKNTVGGGEKGDTVSKGGGKKQFPQGNQTLLRSEGEKKKPSEKNKGEKKGGGNGRKDRLLHRHCGQVPSPCWGRDGRKKGFHGGLGFRIQGRKKEKAGHPLLDLKGRGETRPSGRGENKMALDRGNQPIPLGGGGSINLSHGGGSLSLNRKGEDNFWEERKFSPRGRT